MRFKNLSMGIIALSFLMAPAASKAAGMIVVDPVSGLMPPPPIANPFHSSHPRTRQPSPLTLKGSVSFGLRLEAADIKVEIKDQVAKTYITQTFVNDTDRNLAGTYLFPLPDDTTFSSFSLHIDGKPVEGKILEAQEARQQYEEIVRRMVDPGLLEYADYKTVRARIFPIPAKGSKKVELEYTQLLRAENGLLKYKFPLKTDDETSPADRVNVDVKLSSKQGLRTIWSPTHEIKVNRTDDHQAKVAYAGKDIVPDKDFMLYFSVSDKDLAASLLTHKDTGENGYYLLTLTPPVDSKQTIAKDIVLVADTSGSMAGERMQQNKKALKYLVNALNPDDRFSIVEFNTDVEHFKSTLVPATAANKKAAVEYIDDLEARGGTNICDALKSGGTILDSAGATQRPGYLVLMTDGEPTVGETTIPGLLKSVHTKRDVRIFDFGVGYDVNTRLLNKLAEDHHGTAQYVEPDESLETALSNFYNKIKTPVLTNVKLAYNGVQVKDVYPRNVKDIFAGSQVMLMGRYKDGGTGTVNLTGTVNGAQKSYSFPMNLAAQEAGNTYLPRIWAMRRIGHLTDIAQENGNNREVVNEIVSLSKKYGIISQYTSFLVTDPNERTPVAPMPASPMASAAGPHGVTSWRAGSAGGGGGFAPMLQSAPMRNADKLSGNAAVSGKLMASRQRAAHFYSAPSEIRIIDDRPVIHDFRESPAASSMSFGDVGSYGGGADGSRRDVGRAAVKQAKAANVLKEVTSMAEERKAGMKTVEDKTFYLQGETWIDSTYTGGKTENIVYGSKEYFDLIHNHPGISKFLSVGRQVIFAFKGHIYKVTDK